MGEHWDDADRAVKTPPIAGVLANQLIHGLTTRGLPLTVVTREPGVVPRLVLTADSSHPLSIELTEGIRWQRIEDLSAEMP